MDRRQLVLAIAAFAVAAIALPLRAQRQDRVWRIGMLETTSRTANSANVDALRKGLRDLGYVEGKNLIIHYRSADGRSERFAELANELVLEKVDLIITRGTPAARAAMSASATIPIVTAAIGSPVSTGVVKSLAQPGGQVTGLSAITLDLTGKRFELLKEIFPKIARVGLLADMSNPNSQYIWTETERATRSRGIRAQLLDARKADDLKSAFEGAKKDHLGALIVATEAVMVANQRAIVDFAAQYKLPVMSSAREFVEAGGLISYGVYYPDLYYRAASYVDKILKGAKPGDLPIEQPTKFQLVINLKAARALGLTIPKELLLRADEVIE